MPFKEIKFDQIVFDPEVQTYCNNPKFKCPNYGHSWCCPPSAPYLEDEVSKFKEFKIYLIYVKFDLNSYMEEIKKKHPKRSESRLWASIYRKNFIRDYLEEEILDFTNNYKEPSNERLILWDGHCRVCDKNDEFCTYDLGEPCRYPNNKKYSMEAVGINVDKTVRNLNIEIEWPPINFFYRFGLVCFK